MSREGRLEATIRPSLLDRLTDGDHRAAEDPLIDRAESIRRFREGVLRDLEWLLNSRRTIEAAGEGHPETRDSVYNFGLPDLSSLSGDSGAARTVLLRGVQDALRLFEPRIEATRIAFVAGNGSDRLRIRFLIEGTLRLDDGPERISFDTVLDVASGTFRMQEGVRRNA